MAINEKARELEIDHLHGDFKPTEGQLAVQRAAEELDKQRMEEQILAHRERFLWLKQLGVVRSLQEWTQKPIDQVWTDEENKDGELRHEVSEQLSEKNISLPPGIPLTMVPHMLFPSGRVLAPKKIKDGIYTTSLVMDFNMPNPGASDSEISVVRIGFTQNDTLIVHGKNVTFAEQVEGKTFDLDKFEMAVAKASRLPLPPDRK